MGGGESRPSIDREHRINGKVEAINDCNVVHEDQQRRSESEDWLWHDVLSSSLGSVDERWTDVWSQRPTVNIASSLHIVDH